MFDLIVIGCGSGGYAAAIRASQLGGKVAIVEAGKIGGTCVNRGCIPSKIWLRSAYLLNTIRQAGTFGIEAPIGKMNFDAIIERKNAVAGEIALGMESLLGNYGIELIRGRAQMKSPTTIDVDGKVLETRKVILGTGGSEDTPDIPGLSKALMTPAQVFDMKAPPASILLWGDGGPVDVEMATLFHSLGSSVMLATHNPRILPMEDGETAQRLSQAFREQGIQVATRTTLEAVEKGKKGFTARLAGKQEQTVEIEKVLVSARRPNTQGLGLKSIGVDVNEDGSLRIDDKLETTVDGVYAIGDVTGGWANSHAASSMGVTAAENAMGRDNVFPFHLVPRGIWTIPQVGAVGLSEEEAEEKGYEVEVGDFPFTINGLAMSLGEVDGAVKVVFDADGGDILGVHIVGANATELIGEAVMALQLECSIHDLAETIRVHPTYSEAVMDAGRDSAHWALYLPRR